MNEQKNNGYNLPLAIILSITGLILLVVSFFLPWWHRYDVNLGSMWSIYIFKSETNIPLKISEFIWGVIRPELREAIQNPFYFFITSTILVILGTSLTLVPLFLKLTILNKKVVKIFNLIGGILAILSVLTFINNINFFLDGRGMQLFSSGEPIRWGLASGIYSAIAGGLISIISSILYLVGSEFISIELVIEKQ